MFPCWGFLDWAFFDEHSGVWGFLEVFGILPVSGIGLLVIITLRVGGYMHFLSLCIFFAGAHFLAELGFMT